MHTQTKALFGEIPTNNQALSLFRILFALVLLYDLFFGMLPLWDFLYSPQGASKPTDMQTTLFWSLMQYSNSALYQAGFFVLYAIALFGFLIGYKTRFCAFLGFVLLRMILARDPTTNSNSEMLQSYLLLWSSFMPLDRYWSWAAATRDDTASSKKRDHKWPIIPVIAIKTQIMLIYFCSGMYKLGDASWVEGKAITSSLNDTIWGTVSGAKLLLHFPEWFLYSSCWAIILFQIAFSILIYMPYKNDIFRAVTLLFAACMHISFMLFMNIGTFPYLSLVYLVLLFPDRWIEAALHKRRHRLEKIRIFYDSECDFCRKVARIFQEMCLSPYTSVRPAKDDEDAQKLLKHHNSWIVYGADGQLYTHWDAVSYILKQNPAFWIFGRLFELPLIRPQMKKLYTQIGHHRAFLGKLSKPFLRTQTERYPDATQQTLCLLLITIATSFTLWSLPQIKSDPPKHLNYAAWQLGVWQQWPLFINASTPLHYAINLNGVTENEENVSLEPYSKPVLQTHYGFIKTPSLKTSKYFQAMFKEDDTNKKGLARYLCWQSYDNGKTLKEIEIDLKIYRKYPVDIEWENLSAFNCSDMTEGYKK